MSKRDEIIRTYHCIDTYGESCTNDCKECEKEIAEMLDDFEKEIRADAIDEFYNRLLMHKNAINSSHYPWNYIELTAREMTKQLKEKMQKGAEE